MAKPWGSPILLAPLFLSCCSAFWLSALPSKILIHHEHHWCRGATLGAKLTGGMPSADDLAELDRILSGEQDWEEVDWSQVPSNKPPSRGAKPKPAAPPPPTQAVLAPNANWRTAPGLAPQPLAASASTKTRKPPPASEDAWNSYGDDAEQKAARQDDDDDDAFSYDDFEAALREVDNLYGADGGGRAGKMDRLPPRAAQAAREAEEDGDEVAVWLHKGIESGAVIPEDVWACLEDPLGGAAAAGGGGSGAGSAAKATVTTTMIKGQKVTLSSPALGPSMPSGASSKSSPVAPASTAFKLSRLLAKSPGEASGAGGGGAAGARLDVCVVYADPRRSGDEFTLVLNQLSRIPTSSGNSGSTSIVAINNDDVSDQRKFLKKNALSFPLLTDSSSGGKFMSAIKARSSGRLSSCLMLVTVESATAAGMVGQSRQKNVLSVAGAGAGAGQPAYAAKVLKVWYANDFDPSTVCELVKDELAEVRRLGKRLYLEGQIGLR